MNTEILTWILGLISAFLAVKWQKSAKENENLKQKLNIKKEELYTDFVKFYMSLMNKKQEGEEELQQKILCGSRC